MRRVALELLYLGDMGKRSVWAAVFTLTVMIAGVTRAEEPKPAEFHPPFIPIHIVYGNWNSSTDEGRKQIKELTMQVPHVNLSFNEVVRLCKTDSDLARKAAELMNGIQNYRLQVDYVIKSDVHYRLHPEIHFQLVRTDDEGVQTASNLPASKTILPASGQLPTYKELDDALEQLRNPLNEIHKAQQEESKALYNIDHYTTDTTDRTGLKAI